MKKITFLLFFLTTSIIVAQTWTTGTVILDTDYTVKFDIDTETEKVTMTMIGPDNVWLGVAPGIESGNGMGNLNDDAIIYNSNGLEDRNMPRGVGEPPLDNNSNPIDEWTLLSNNASEGVITIIATRAINTGDSKDFVFPTLQQSLPILWAYGKGKSFAYHGTNRGGTVANLTLGVSDDFSLKTALTIYPNPSRDILNINISNLIDNNLNLQVFDVLGHEILNQKVNNLSSKITISEWNTGVYLLKMSSITSGASVIKRFVKL